MINNTPNSTHPALTPSIIFKEPKLNSMSKDCLHSAHTALHDAKWVDNKYQSQTENVIILIK